MTRRILPLCVAALALALLAGMPLLAADKAAPAKPATHDVTIVKASGNQLTVLGADGKEHTHPLAKGAAVSCNGKSCKVTDLKKGAKATVTVVRHGKQAEFSKVEAKIAKPAAKPAKTAKK